MNEWNWMVPPNFWAMVFQLARILFLHLRYPTLAFTNIPPPRNHLLMALRIPLDSTFSHPTSLSQYYSLYAASQMHFPGSIMELANTSQREGSPSPRDKKIDISLLQECKMNSIASPWLRGGGEFPGWWKCGNDPFMLGGNRNDRCISASKSSVIRISYKNIGNNDLQF